MNLQAQYLIRRTASGKSVTVVKFTLGDHHVMFRSQSHREAVEYVAKHARFDEAAARCLRLAIDRAHEDAILENDMFDDAQPKATAHAEALREDAERIDAEHEAWAGACVKDAASWSDVSDELLAGLIAKTTYYIRHERLESFRKSSERKLAVLRREQERRAARRSSERPMQTCHCGHEWQAQQDEPVACPMCGRNCYFSSGTNAHVHPMFAGVLSRSARARERHEVERMEDDAVAEREEREMFFDDGCRTPEGCER